MIAQPIKGGVEIVSMYSLFIDFVLSLMLFTLALADWRMWKEIQELQEELPIKQEDKPMKYSKFDLSVPYEPLGVSRHNKKWTQEEKAHAKRLIDKEVHPLVIAKRIGRTENSVVAFKHLYKTGKV